jgi:hypothetical protein
LTTDVPAELQMGLLPTQPWQAQGSLRVPGQMGGLPLPGVVDAQPSPPAPS